MISEWCADAFYYNKTNSLVAVYTNISDTLCHRVVSLTMCVSVSTLVKSSLFPIFQGLISVNRSFVSKMVLLAERHTMVGNVMWLFVFA